MCDYAELRDEVRMLRSEIEGLGARMTAVETRVQDAVLTRADVQAAITESNVLTREEFEDQLFTTVSDVGARVRRALKHAVYGVAGFLAVIAGIIMALERIWGVFS